MMVPASTGRDAAPTGLARRVRSTLGEDARFWRFAAGLLFAFAILKGLRPPGAWALTQAQIDYSHGFLKRGLEGAIFSLLHIHHALPMTVAFFLQLAALIVLVVLLARSAGVEQRFGTLLPMAVVGSGYAITYLTHVIGYTDIPLAAAAVLLLLIRRPGARFLAGLLVVPLAVLMHENFLLMFAPVVFFSFLVDALTGASERRRTLGYAAALAVLAVTTALATSARPHLSDDDTDRFATEIQARADFEIRDDVLDVLTRPLSMAFREGTTGMTIWPWRTFDLITLANILPAALLLGWFVRRLLAAAFPQDPATRRLLWAGVLAVTVAPLLLYLLGVDGGRWNSAAYIELALALLLLCRALPEARVTLGPAERHLALLVIFLGLISGGGLFGHERVNTFPFVPDIVDNFRVFPA